MQMTGWTRIYRPLLVIGAIAALAIGAQASTISLFPTGTSVDLTITIDTATSTITSSDVRGAAGFVVTNPPIANGVVVSDFGLFPAPSNELLGSDALTLSQYLLFTLNIGGLTVGGPGIEVPVSTTDVTSPITDPALLQFQHPLEFGFSIVSSNTVGDTQTVVLSLATVNQLNQVPEPATVATLACSLGVLLVFMRRRRVRRLQAS